MRNALILLSILVICLGPARFAVARDCDDELEQQYGSVSGLLVDARRHVDADDDLDLSGLPSLSKEDRWTLFKSAKFGPHFALIEDGTNRAFAFYVYYLPGSPEQETIAESTERFTREGAGFLGRRVRATGCVSSSPAWPHVHPFDGLELLE